MNNAALVVALASLCACATVSQRQEPVEAPRQALQPPAAVTPRHRYKMKLAIARFTNESNYGRSLLNDQDLDRLGKQAGDMLMSRLVLSGNFLVLERPDAAKIQHEQAVAGAGGTMIGADTVISGSVTEFGRSIGGKSGFLSSTKLQTARAKVDIRLVEVKTGLAYFSAQGSGEANNETGEVAGFGSHSEYDATLNDRAIGAAISDVVDRLLQKLADRPWQTDILEVKGSQVFISGGQRQGLRPGDDLAVLEPGKVSRSKQSGFEVTLPARQIATVKVVSLFGESETSEGSVCEVTSGAVDPAAASGLIVREAARGNP